MVGGPVGGLFGFGFFASFYPHPEGLDPSRPTGAQLAWYGCCERTFDGPAPPACPEHRGTLERYWDIARCRDCDRRLYYQDDGSIRSVPPDCGGRRRHEAKYTRVPQRRGA